MQSYAQGKSIAKEIDCPFYKAIAKGKQKLLMQ
jgi:hypothetical protein